MNVKSVVVVCALLVFVSVVAVRGSKAEPLTAEMSAAFAQCHTGSAWADSCRSLISPSNTAMFAAAEQDFDQIEQGFDQDLGQLVDNEICMEQGDPDRKVGEFLQYIGEILFAVGRFVYALT